MNEKKLISLMILTHNRPYYLRRILDYYDKYGEDYNIVVADSSSDENKKANKKIISSFSSLNISHLNNYSSTINMFYKVADALNSVNEKYCIICADDDFTTPLGINTAIDFLERNPDFSCAHGDYISFYLNDDKKGQKQFYWKQAPPFKSIISPDPKTRILSHFSNYFPTFYAVHRTDFVNMLFKETMKFTDDVRFGELLPSMLALIHGKMKHLDVLYGAREIPLHSEKIIIGTRFRDFVSEGTYDKKYSRFRNCLVTHLNKNSRISILEGKKFIDKCWAEYTKKYKGFLIPKIKYMLKKLSLPDSVDLVVRETYRKMFCRNNHTLDIGGTYDTPTKYRDEFNKIKKHVLDHSKI